MDQYESEDEERGRPGAPVDIGRLIHALMKRWRVIPIAGAIGAVVGLLYAAFIIRPAYTARATILWEPPGEANGRSEDAFLTQVDSIKLPVNLVEVRRRMKLNATLEMLRDRINLLFDGHSHLVVLEVADTSGQNAARLVNTTVEVFFDSQRQVGRQRGDEQLRALNADIEVSQAQLKNARDAYDAFRKQLGVSDFDAETKLAIEHAAELKRQADLSGAAADTEGVRQRILTEEAARQAPTTNSTTSLTNPDAIALGQARTQLAGARSHLAPDHPEIRQLEAQVQALEARVKSGTGVVQGGVSVAPNTQYLSLQAGLSQSKVAKETEIERQETYKRFAQEAEKRLQQLAGAEGQAQQLASRVTVLEGRVTELETQRVRARDAIRNVSPNFRVVTAATPPEKPDPSARRSTAIKFPIVAVLLALLAIIGFELRGLRVHTAREAGFWANTPVIASSTWPRDPSMLGVLVDELGDAAPGMRGTTLVVGARVNDVPLAREIAYWLSHLTGWSQRTVIGEVEPLVTPPASPAPAPATPLPPKPAAQVARGPEIAPTTDPHAQIVRRPSTDLTVAQAWDGPPTGPSLRRAARLADRVLVVVASGTLTVTDLAQLRSRLGRETGIGLLLVGLNPEFVQLPDRVGEVDSFWQARTA